MPQQRKQPFTYYLEHGSYYYYGGTGVMEFMADEIAMVFDDDPDGGLVRLKHGSRKDVETWWDTTKAEYKKNGLSDLTFYWRLISGNLPVNEVNRANACSGYRPSFLPEVTVSSMLEGAVGGES
jgi:hypothetical protein